jgi:CubicO group peptidase (beta-lactamase class C family)
MKQTPLLLVLVLAIGVPVHHIKSNAATQKVARKLPPDISRMEAVIQSFVDAKQFMGSVLVARGEKVLLDKGYGFANLEWRIPNSPDTKFCVGSLTKQFTAASILLLQQRGKLNIDDAVKVYIPDAPSTWDKITIFNLLTHTSGIPSFTRFPEYRSMKPFPKTPEQMVALFRDKPLDFDPGAKWSYSNSGYILLGYLIEKISGQKYGDFVQANIFKPLGMVDSGYDSNAAIIQNRASGYIPESGGFLNAHYIDMTIPFSAGALYSTTDDLLRWERGVFGGKLLSPELAKKMTTPFKDKYALGLGVDDLNGHPVIGHTGGMEGFNTSLTYFPDDKLTVIVLGNINGAGPEQIALDLSTLAFQGSVVLTSEREQIHLDPKVFGTYVGTYQFEPNSTVTVSRENEHFMVQTTGGEKVEVFPETVHDFFAKTDEIQIKFHTDSQGHSTDLILHELAETPVGFFPADRPAVRVN